jgi:hypothetical protein
LQEREKEIEEKKKKQAEKKNAEVTTLPKLDKASFVRFQILIVANTKMAAFWEYCAMQSRRS